MDSPSRSAVGWLSAWLVRAEDIALAVWVAFVVPVLYRVQGSTAGPFDPGRPVDGVVGIIGIAGAVVCLAARTAPEIGVAPRAAVGRGAVPGLGPAPASRGGGTSAGGYAIGSSAAVGPFAGGLIAVGASAASGLSLAGPVAEAGAAGLAILAIAVRLWLPPLPPGIRRLLVTPYIVAAGGLFGSFIDAVTAGDVPGRLRAAAPADLGGAAPVIGFLLAFSAVVYAMLVFAPRQIAEREGGPVAWLVRYGCFVLSVALGAGWIRLVSG